MRPANLRPSYLNHSLTSNLFFSQLFYLFAVLDLIDEDFRRLKAWNKMFVNYQCRVAGDISSNFLFSLFIDETAKSSYIYILSACHGRFYDVEEGLYRCRYICFVYTCLFRDFVDDVRFSHNILN